MKKFKFILSIIMMIAILLSFYPFSFATVTDNDNGKMKYYKRRDINFDIQGYVNGKIQSTTFNDSGYDTFLKVDNGEVEELLFYNQDKLVNGVKWDINCSFINNGRYVKITYTLTNTENKNKTISLGSTVDVQIADNDYATIERFENSKGLKLFNEEENIQFNFYGKSVAGTIDIDNMWIGSYWEMDDGDKQFANNTVNKLEEEDSAFTYSWTNRTLVANSTNTYSVIIGMGEVSNAPKIELDENQGNCFSKDSVIIKGIISDVDKNSKATLYYTVDEGTEKNLAEKSLTNNKLNFSLDLTSQNLSLGKHKLKLWAIDEMGNPSEITEKQILISNLKAPTLNMSEQWSKEAVKFTITDTINEEANVSKYQYKIGNGKWQDVALDTEVEALNTTGTVVVVARALGKEADEYSSTVSKTAKVDKNKPTIKVEENNGKVTINVTDEHSGADSTKYVFTNTEELSDKEEYTEYKEAIQYSGTEKKDVYLHVISTDKVGNEKSYVKQYKFPVSAEIKSEEKFVVQKPTYKLEDENKQVEKKYTYQVKINNSEWKNVNINQQYTIENPVEGKNIITTRTIDLLGRMSTEKKVEITYQKVDNTVVDKEIPAAGSIVISLFVLTTLLMVSLIVLHKYNKLRDIK